MIVANNNSEICLVLEFDRFHMEFAPKKIKRFHCLVCFRFSIIREFFHQSFSSLCHYWRNFNLIFYSLFFSLLTDFSSSKIDMKFQLIFCIENYFGSNLAASQISNVFCHMINSVKQRENELIDLDCLIEFVPLFKWCSLIKIQLGQLFRFQ